MYLGPYQRPAQLHSAIAQQGSSMKGRCAEVGIGTTAFFYIVLIIKQESLGLSNGQHLDAFFSWG